MPSNKYEEAGNLIPIASFLPGELELKNIKSALEEMEIDFRMEGSRVYQILVLPKDAEKTISVLNRIKLAGKMTIYSMLDKGDKSL